MSESLSDPNLQGLTPIFKHTDGYLVGYIEVSREKFYVDIDQLLFKEPVTAGADIWVIIPLAKFYRGCNEDSEPIVVKQDKGFWRIMDGRHRVIASIIAGRKKILAVEEL